MAINWFKLGKYQRSPFGKFLDRHQITQEEIRKQAGISKSTVSRLCNPARFEPNMKTARKILKVLKKYDKNVTYEDFWH